MPGSLLAASCDFLAEPEGTLRFPIFVVSDSPESGALLQVPSEKASEAPPFIETADVLDVARRWQICFSSPLHALHALFASGSRSLPCLELLTLPLKSVLDTGAVAGILPGAWHMRACFVH